MSIGDERGCPRQEAASETSTTKSAPSPPLETVSAQKIRPAKASSVTQEPSAWLRAAVARRVRQVRSAGLDPNQTDPMIVAPLGRAAAPGSREDRACDRCRRYTPEGRLFYPFGFQPLPGLLLVGGLCAACHRKEVAR